MSMDLWVFNVGRGLCVAIRTPNGHLCIMDCGCSDDFSPAKWLAAQNWTLHKGFNLAYLIISHPHLDHIADIESVTRQLKPFMILRRKDLDWKRVTSGGSDQSAPTRHYVTTYMPPGYNATIREEDKPDWGDGFTIRSFCLSEATASKISVSDNSYVNNSSFVTVVNYKGYCIALNGDIETAGMEALLQQSGDLQAAIKPGVHFYLSPHHGHPSGFSTDWFKVAGKTVIMNIVSERRKSEDEDDSVTKIDSRYSQEDFCKGDNREGRKLVSTKSDGHIYIHFTDDGMWSWKAIK